MHFNRLAGYFAGQFSLEEVREMSFEAMNDEVNAALDTRLSQLNAMVEQIEARLASLRVVRDTYVAYLTQEDEDDQGRQLGAHHRYLGIVKTKGAWRLCCSYEYQSYSGGRPDEIMEWKQVIEGNVDERMDAIRFAHLLEQEIIDSKKAVISELETVIAEGAKRLGKGGETSEMC